MPNTCKQTSDFHVSMCTWYDAHCTLQMHVCIQSYANCISGTNNNIIIDMNMAYLNQPLGAASQAGAIRERGIATRSAGMATVGTLRAWVAGEAQRDSNGNRMRLQRHLMKRTGESLSKSGGFWSVGLLVYWSVFKHTWYALCTVTL